MLTQPHGADRNPLEIAKPYANSRVEHPAQAKIAADAQREVQIRVLVATRSKKCRRLNVRHDTDLGILNVEASAQ